MNEPDDNEGVSSAGEALINMQKWTDAAAVGGSGGQLLEAVAVNNLMSVVPGC